jgi:hypothetical protein
MIYLVPNKRGYVVSIKLLGRTYCRVQRRQKVDALAVVAEMQSLFPDAGVAILADFST